MQIKLKVAKGESLFHKNEQPKNMKSLRKRYLDIKKNIYYSSDTFLKHRKQNTGTSKLTKPIVSRQI